ncbi:MAG: NAD(P)H-dependent oxidoreductase [Treponema sp.]|nr:NAD(P)H-dependent oxidoreductase [Treponema sp.]
MTEAGGEAKIVRPRGEEINPCLGCFDCWVKTPGICIQTRDCANNIAAMQMNSDAVIYISKITWGSYSYDIKSFLDRCIPNIMPFFYVVNGEMRHKMRYKKFPYIISIGYGAKTEREKTTFENLAKRNALNLMPPKYFVFSIDSSSNSSNNSAPAQSAAAVMESLKNVLVNEVNK